MADVRDPDDNLFSDCGFPEVKEEPFIPAKPITDEQRRAWIKAAKEQTTAPPEEWTDRIIAGKPSFIETQTSGQFFAVCDLQAAGILRITEMKAAKLRGWILSIYFPAPDQPDLI